MSPPSRRQVRATAAVLSLLGALALMFARTAPSYGSPERSPGHDTQLLPISAAVDVIVNEPDDPVVAVIGSQLLDPLDRSVGFACECWQLVDHAAPAPLLGVAPKTSPPPRR